MTLVPAILVQVPVVPFLYSIVVATLASVPSFTLIAVSSVAVTPVGASGRDGIISVCAVLSVVAEPSPFFTMLNVVPSQLLSITSLPLPSAVTAVPFTVYEPIAVRPVSSSAA
ncbi:hypothetical protein D3C71_1904040 [compost metagenome]